jgi:hypothetical protein
MSWKNWTLSFDKDALKAGLLLKYQFPHDDIKVYETKSADKVRPGTVFH